MIYRYFVLTLTACALLLGIQAPNLLTQYQQRLAAQYAEAKVYYDDYQVIADRYFEGELDALIAAHENSTEPAFREEAAIIRKLVQRITAFERQQQLQQQSYPAQLWALVWQHDEELLQGTLEQYSFNVPLTQTALATGALVALAFALLSDVLVGGCKRLGRRYKRHPKTLKH
ncbi:DUF2937 family protein [Pseudidiomarina sediminum]|uniref:DUF2937 family protein n=1 Tax=Pseudidiomarina sediminum TaxID=431675 RepID=UPI001C97D09E|nr:DUF2937 family protein [Pseudidiomarina sediminum]MBY6063007.1 DUF2937 family protein [Pseudidiomarina sediminum]